MLVPADEGVEEAIGLGRLACDRRMNRPGGNEEQQVSKLVEERDTFGETREADQRQAQAARRRPGSEAERQELLESRPA